MLERIITSKTRIKVLKLFLSEPDKRYYLRELSRMLNESLSPLRRQLIKLIKMGILDVEQEANLKYYRLNKEFQGVEELRRLVRDDVDREPKEAMAPVIPARRMRYDLVALTLFSFFISIIAVYVIYTSSRNVIEVTKAISQKGVSPVPSVLLNENKERFVVHSDNKSGEMVSRRWKVLPGNFPGVSAGENIKGGD